MAEVELGKLAAQKAQDPQVKQFGQRMVDDHKKDVSEFRSASKSKDAEVKQFASETLPTLEQHLQMAQSIQKSK